MPEPGDRMLLRLEGGPVGWRAVTFPPPLELHERSGRYVLVDDGPPEGWWYELVAGEGR
ncbi:MAG TPA: hypothetical protein VMN58_06345 [Acidimicrobiales bacterium]|nr:hypothetical protein [Acidimicrobiales bacterium]